MQHHDPSSAEQDTPIDAIDLQIIEILQKDGRAPYSTIARTLDLPETTVRYRVKKLLDGEIITISAFLNTGKINYNNVAYIQLKTKSDFFQKSLNSFLEIDNISYISSVTGDYNIMLEYVYESNNDLIIFLNWLGDQPDVDQVNSRIILRIYKAQYPARIRS